MLWDYQLTHLLLEYAVDWLQGSMVTKASTSVITPVSSSRSTETSIKTHLWIPRMGFLVVYFFCKSDVFRLSIKLISFRPILPLNRLCCSLIICSVAFIRLGKSSSRQVFYIPVSFFGNLNGFEFSGSLSLANTSLNHCEGSDLKY